MSSLRFDRASQHFDVHKHTHIHEQCKYASSIVRMRTCVLASDAQLRKVNATADATQCRDMHNAYEKHEHSVGVLVWSDRITCDDSDDLNDDKQHCGGAVKRVIYAIHMHRHVALRAAAFAGLASSSTTNPAHACAIFRIGRVSPYGPRGEHANPPSDYSIICLSSHQPKRRAFGI